LGWIQILLYTIDFTLIQQWAVVTLGIEVTEGLSSVFVHPENQAASARACQREAVLKYMPHLQH
jgi:hypothetical protein